MHQRSCKGGGGSAAKGSPSPQKSNFDGGSKLGASLKPGGMGGGGMGGGLGGGSGIQSSPQLGYKTIKKPKTLVCYIW